MKQITKYLFLLALMSMPFSLLADEVQFPDNDIAEIETMTREATKLAKKQKIDDKRERKQYEKKMRKHNKAYKKQEKK